MPRQRTVKARLKKRNQTIGTWTVTINPKDNAAVRDLLAELLDQRGEEPSPAHRLELYTDRGALIREVSAA
jgi:hypothetical protein